MYRKTAKKLLKFIEKSPTAFQAVTEMTKRLDKEGFEELKEEDHWKLKKGGNYYVTRNHSAIIAFSIPQKPVWKFHIMASHSDSPSLKIKENPEIEVENAYIKLNVERYGGMILSPWFDRPLSVAGRLIVRQDEKIREKMVTVDRDLLVIPNLAIHMNREMRNLSLHPDWMICSVHSLLWRDSCREIVKKAFLYIVCWIMKKWEAVQDRGLLLLS